MSSKQSKFNWLITGMSLLFAASLNIAAFADDRRSTPEQFAELYMKTFNAKDLPGLRKLRYPVKGKSDMQEMINGITEATMSEGDKFTKFEILPPKPDMDKANMGPDGLFYKSQFKTNALTKT